MSLEIVHAENNWWVVNKPVGLSVHNAESSKTGDDLIGLLAKQVKIPRGELAPVHRLDQETSGLIVISRGEVTSKLVAALDMPNSAKKYVSILRGKFGNLGDSGSWDWPLSPKAEGRRDPQGKAIDRKQAKTLYNVIAQNQYFTLVELELITGRTHQIRRHAALARHNVVGDRRYDTEKYCDLISQKYGFKRMALHACELSFLFSEKKHTFSSSAPDDFSKLIQ